MIEIRDLSFSYGVTPFVQSLSLTLENGAFTALVGENGSGKSTLLKLITGSEKPASGEIFVDGVNIHATKKRELAKKLSYFPQSRPTPDMRAEEVVLMGRYPYTRGFFSTPQKDKEITLSAMEAVGVSAFAERNMQTLSFGERQKVYLAMLLSQETGNCLFDEPTNFMDISGKFMMLEKLSALKREGKCVLCVLHDLSLAMRYADRIIVMKNGAVFADGAPKALYESGAIDKAFGVRTIHREEDGVDTYTFLPKSPDFS